MLWLNQDILLPEAGKCLKIVGFGDISVVWRHKFFKTQENGIQKTEASSITNSCFSTQPFPCFQRSGWQNSENHKSWVPGATRTHKISTSKLRCVTGLRETGIWTAVVYWALPAHKIPFHVSHPTKVLFKQGIEIYGRYMPMVQWRTPEGLRGRKHTLFLIESRLTTDTEEQPMNPVWEFNGVSPTAMLPFTLSYYCND